MSNKTIFITGCSTGIGRELTLCYLKKKWKVVGTYRQEKDIQDYLINYPQQFVGLCLNLQRPEEISLIPEKLVALNINNLNALVNNAGLALAGPLEYQSEQEIFEILQVNVLAVIQLTKLLIPFLKKQPHSRIVNISSVSGVGGTPFLSVYCASKHALEGFSEALRRELNLYGIFVSVVGPGSIKTPIWIKGFKKVAELYKGTEFQESFQSFIDFASAEEKKALEPLVVVRNIEHAIESAHPKIRYAPIPRKWLNVYLPRLIPKTIYDQLMIKALRLEMRKKT